MKISIEFVHLVAHFCECQETGLVETQIKTQSKTEDLYKQVVNKLKKKKKGKTGNCTIFYLSTEALCISIFF